MYKWLIRKLKAKEVGIVSRFFGLFIFLIKTTNAQKICISGGNIMSERFERGQKKIQEVIGVSGQTVVSSFEKIAPDLSRYIAEFPFGDIYSRTGLDLQKKQLVTVSSLVTQGDTAQALDVHLNAALNVGLTPNEIIEALLQLLPYAGWPKVQNAVNIAEKVFSDRKVAPVWDNK